MKVTYQNMMGRESLIDIPPYDDAETGAIKMTLMTGIPHKVKMVLMEEEKS